MRAGAGSGGRATSMGGAGGRCTRGPQGPANAPQRHAPLPTCTAAPAPAPPPPPPKRSGAPRGTLPSPRALSARAVEPSPQCVLTPCPERSDPRGYLSSSPALLTEPPVRPCALRPLPPTSPRPASHPAGGPGTARDQRAGTTRPRTPGTSPFGARARRRE